ncbi:Yip1 domain-containing protein [Palleronia salina]|uniref:Yip1 domain-containing protein n=1 Tax=Palleronia salina TaxID=313368 RepID=A0A1M6ATZ1_9RHOB|nr:YIP1 family protein [Palleronia salina]SHI39945.1 Yip1 domain-containing protein [Palleronia salina]
MNLMSPATLGQLVVSTLRAPRPTFRVLLEMGLPRDVLWQALTLVAVLSLILSVAVNAVFVVQVTGSEQVPPEEIITLSPLMVGLIQFAVLVVSVFLIDWVGKKFKGTGSFNGAILAVTWLQVMMVGVQLVQMLLLLALPVLGSALTLLGMVLFFWLLTNFIAELHGFTSLGRVFGMILFVMVGVALGLSFLLTLVGITVPR